ncbi:MAG TPA: GNAT family protein [Actinomycetota bacterium]|jgi:ribosomal-protein-alanine N-acetyltransferase
MVRAIERGDRVFLRHPDASDEHAFIEAVRSSRDLHHPWTHLPDTRRGFAAMLQRLEHPSEEGYLVCRNEDGALAGLANLGQIFLGDFRSAYLGYSAFAPHQGQGFMREGLTLVLRRAFGPIGLHRVEANVQPDNARSIALAESLGFRREGYSPKYLKIGGRWRDHVRFAILAEEFLAAQAGRPRRR